MKQISPSVHNVSWICSARQNSSTVPVSCVVPIIPNQIRWRPRGAAGSGRALPPGRAGGPVPAAARRAASRGDRAARRQACLLRRPVARPRHLRLTAQGEVFCMGLQRLPSSQMPWVPVGAEADVHEWRYATKSEAPIVACAASEGFGCPFPPL